MLTPVVPIGVGIDTARYGHHVTMFRADLQPAAPPLDCAESPAGYQKLEDVLQQLATRTPNVHFHIRVDAAGQYAANLEAFLRRLPLPITLSIGEPARNRRYREAFFPKRKADAVESQAMARYAVVEQPAATPALPAELATLRELVSRLEGQSRQSTRLTNQLHKLGQHALAPISDPEAWDVARLGDCRRWQKLDIISFLPEPTGLGARFRPGRDDLWR